MHQLLVVHKHDEGRRLYSHLGHVVDLQPAALVGGLMDTCVI